MKVFRWILILLLLAGGAVLCSIRWQAWFGNPSEPAFKGDTLAYRFACFGDDSVPGFVQTEQGWQDTIEPSVLRIILFGDIHNQMDSADYAEVLVRHDSIDCYAQLGDWMERGYFYYEQQLYHQLAGTGMEALPVINCPGNHEYYKGLVRTLPERWTNMFRHPQNGPVRFAGTTYYVDFPQLRFIVLNTNGLQRLSDYTIVNTWLKKALRTAGDRYTLVMMHHPVYSSGKGRINLAIWLTFHWTLQEADVVFAGHDHSYAQRGHFINTNSSRKMYKNKRKNAVVSPSAQNRLYELIELYSDTLRIETLSLDSLYNVQTFEVTPLVEDSAAVTEQGA